MPMDIDEEFLETKLKDYKLLTDLSTVQMGDHLRYTSNKYKEDGRKCSYIIIKSIDEAGIFQANSYKPIYKDWKIDPFNQYKKYRFYKKVENKHTGYCVGCNFPLRNPFTTCFECSKKEVDTK